MNRFWKFVMFSLSFACVIFIIYILWKQSTKREIPIQTCVISSDIVRTGQCSFKCDDIATNILNNTYGIDIRMEIKSTCDQSMVCCPKHIESIKTANIETVKNKTSMIAEDPIFLSFDVEWGDDKNIAQNFLDNKMNLINDKKCGTFAGVRITNGLETQFRQFTFMANLKYQETKNFTFLCGGSVISDKYVLTAAHCILENLVAVRLGEFIFSREYDCDNNDECQPAEDFDIEKVIIHTGFDDKRLQNDIALIKLVKSFKMSDLWKHKQVNSICLPFQDDLKIIKDETIFTVIGHGITERGATSDLLMQTFVPYVSIDKCKEIYEKKGKKLVEGSMCAGGFNKTDSCSGDSGGPLLAISNVLFKDIHKMRFVQFGIVSYGMRDCGKINLTPAVYTKVSHYKNWILNHIEL